jgi:hypothetical protein
VGHVVFLGTSWAQLQGLPSDVRRVFEWAIVELDQQPSALPRDPKLQVETAVIDGPFPLRRVSVSLHPPDPGYRAIYALEGRRVLFVRFAHRDRDTYKGLRRLYALIGSEGRC